MISVRCSGICRGGVGFISHATADVLRSPMLEASMMSWIGRMLKHFQLAKANLQSTRNASQHAHLAISSFW
jgi:hypothetical protein